MTHCSLVLNPLEFYFCGYRQSIVYAEQIPDVQVLGQRLYDICRAH